MDNTLVPVISVDKEKCVNCHACITACPVKYCNDGSSDSVQINSNMCIGCGSCIVACTHEARSYIDDWGSFIKNVKSGVPMVAIVAPAVAANFPDQYLQLNGWLKSLGVAAAFDVSFGAELTVKTYLEHVKKNSPKTVIAQPCPAIVSFVEVYKPELLPYLAPADSPMLHTIKMVKEFYPQFASHKTVVISPCIAKKREFVETGLGDYNVTYKSIRKYLSEYLIDLSKYPATEYDNAPAERAVLFSTPGGLMRTAEREFPGITNVTRKIEGPHTIYEYLEKLPDMIKEGKNPVLIDCLNCEMGCNGGSGTLNQHSSPDEVEFEIEKRNQEMQRRYKGGFPHFFHRSKLKGTINSYWKPGLYGRTYVDHSNNNSIKMPTESEMESTFKRMSKTSPGDFYNCSSCGYGSCEKMAVAIYNGLNVPENCHFFKHSLVDEQLAHLQENEEELQSESDKLKEVLNQIIEIMEELAAVSRSTERYTDLLSQISIDIYQNDTNIQAIVQEAEFEVSEAKKSTSIMNEMDMAIDQVTQDVAAISQNSVQTFDIASKGSKVVDDTVLGMQEIKKSVLFAANTIDELGKRSNHIGEIVKAIDAISKQTNMLALNAAVEAARAGEHGRGFAVVADEVKKLAAKSSDATNEISQIITEIQEGTQSAVAAMKEGTEQVKKGADLSTTAHKALKDISDSVRAMVDQMKSISSATSEITASSSEVVTLVTNMSDLSAQNTQELMKVNRASSEVVKLIDTIQEISQKNKHSIESIQTKYETIKGLINRAESVS